MQILKYIDSQLGHLVIRPECENTRSLDYVIEIQSPKIHVGKGKGRQQNWQENMLGEIEDAGLTCGNKQRQEVECKT